MEQVSAVRNPPGARLRALAGRRPRAVSRARAIQDSLDETSVHPDELMGVFDEIDFDMALEDSPLPADKSSDMVAAFHALTERMSLDGSDDSAMEVDMPEWVTDGTLTQDLIDGTPEPVTHSQYAGAYRRDCQCVWPLTSFTVTPMRNIGSAQPDTPVLFAHAQWSPVPEVETDEQIQRVIDKIRGRENMYRAHTRPPLMSPPGLSGRIAHRGDAAATPRLRARTRFMHNDSSESEEGEVQPESPPDDSQDDYVPDRLSPAPAPARTPSPIERHHSEEPVEPADSLFSE